MSKKTYILTQNRKMIETNLRLSLASNTHESQRESEAESERLHSPIELDLLCSQPGAQLSVKPFSLVTPPKQLLSGVSLADGSENFDKRSSTSSQSFFQSPVHSDRNVRAPASNMEFSTRSLRNNRIGKRNSSKSCRENKILSTVKSKGTSKDVEKWIPLKKLRLSEKQSTILEESFKKHSTINQNQKNALAKELNLEARQIEVWFQNRRARTKSKQTEVNCDVLKNCWKSLKQENEILQQQIQDLRALKAAPPCDIPHNFQRIFPEKLITICPFCERISNS